MRLRIGLLIVFLLAIAGYFGWRYAIGVNQEKPAQAQPVFAKQRFLGPYEKLRLVWGSGQLPPRSTNSAAGAYSNIEPQDYLGAEKCAECHEEKYRSWSKHPHRWMNAAATPDRVLGDFSGQARIRFQGGEGRFWSEGHHFFMSAERGAVKRRYRINRTIGSRYFQYYVGVQLE